MILETKRLWTNVWNKPLRKVLGMKLLHMLQRNVSHVCQSLKKLTRFGGQSLSMMEKITKHHIQISKLSWITHFPYSLSFLNLFISMYFTFTKQF